MAVIIHGAAIVARSDQIGRGAWRRLLAEHPDLDLPVRLDVEERPARR
jgi:hypothetical protein